MLMDPVMLRKSNSKSKATSPAMALTGLAVVLAAGCAVGPDFHRPEEPKVDRYGITPTPSATTSADVPYGESQAFAIGKQLPSQWWTIFQSKQLDDLVLASFANSPTITAAQAALRQAHENYVAERASIFPFLDFAGSGERQKINSAAFGDPQGGIFIYNLFNTSLNLSYGLDIFGGTRRAIEQQAALEQYQKAQLLSTYQTLAANVVNAVLNEAGNDLFKRSQQEIVDEDEKLLKVTEDRYRFGAIPYSNVLTARSNLANEQSNLLPFETAVVQAQDQLAVYLGKLPADFQPEAILIPAFQLPLEVPLAIPSQLVRQRPDILSAEAQLHAASANIGVATADMLPQVSITASFGSEVSVLHNLFNSSIWSLGANISQPIFHAGALTAKRRAAIAAYDQSAANYRQTVLAAFQNVADALSQVTIDAQTMKLDSEAFKDADDALHIVEEQYRLGGASFLDLLTAQQQQSRAKNALQKAGLLRFVDTVSLFQALGGGSWDANGPIPVAAYTP